MVRLSCQEVIYVTESKYSNFALKMVLREGVDPLQNLRLDLPFPAGATFLYAMYVAPSAKNMSKDD